MTRPLSIWAREKYAAPTPILPPTTWRKVQKQIADRHGVSMAELLGTGRRTQVVLARWECCAAIRDLGFSYPAIAEFMGLKDHTSVIHACRRWAEIQANGGEFMPRKKRKKSPKQIAAELPATRRVEKIASVMDMPGPNLKALQADPGDVVEAQKVGREVFARRSSWIDRILRKGTPEWEAVNRLSDVFAQRLGHDDRASGGISAGPRSLVTDRMLAAADVIFDVFQLIGAKDRELLTELISPRTVTTLSDADRWRQAVARVTGVQLEDAQSAVVRMAAQNLAAAWVAYDFRQGRAA